MRPVSVRSLGRGCALLLLAQLAAHAPVSAKRTQAQLTATFKDRAYPAGTPKAESGCTIRFASLVDERRSPEMAGVIGKRGVLAPADSQAWLRAVLGGLESRGIRPAFEAAPAVGPAPPTASLTLQTAWIASTVVTYSANVVLRLQASAPGGATIDRMYRGRVSRTAYWSGGVDTLQSAMDGAFADALDAMAADLKPLCGA